MGNVNGNETMVGRSPLIMTTDEGGQVRAALVWLSTMQTFIQGSLAGSDAEAFLSLYEESKRITTAAKATLDSEGRWVVES